MTMAIGIYAISASTRIFCVLMELSNLLSVVKDSLTIYANFAYMLSSNSWSSPYEHVPKWNICHLCQLSRIP